MKSEPVAVLGFLGATMGLLAAFGVHLSGVQSQAITAFVTAGVALAFFIRARWHVTPVAKLPPVPQRLGDTITMGPQAAPNPPSGKDGAS
jgi:hypothetical protein